MDLVICYRLFLIYNRDIRILVRMFLVLVLIAAPGTAILGIVIKEGHSVVSPIPGISFCYADSGRADKIFWIMFIPSVFFESIAFACALWQTYRHIREFKCTRQLTGNAEDETYKSLGQQMIEAMFRDSLLYFFFMLIFLLANCIVIRFTIPNHSGFGQISLGPSFSVMSILGTRILLHPRESIEEIYHPEALMSTVPSMQFAKVDESTVSIWVGALTLSQMIRRSSWVRNHSQELDEWCSINEVLDGYFSSNHVV